MEFVSQNKVRMHDTDMAGILYFPRQFRFAHDALEDLFEKHGITFDKLVNKQGYMFVIVHAEADYKAPLKIGDPLEIHVTVPQIGSSSFTVAYGIYKMDGTLSGTAKTVHVTLDAKTRTKIPIPAALKKILRLYHEGEKA